MATNVKVIVHRGTHQIGGCCTEIATKNTKILIDLGMSLPNGDIENLSIEGVTTGDLNCDGILITHYHGDHIGELKNILPKVPVFTGKSTKEIMSAYKKHMGKSFLGDMSPDDVRTIQDGKSFNIGDIMITPIQSDHSSFQPYMFLLETGGKRILHTGDFRLHGQHYDRIMSRLRELGNVDLLITEGTTLTRTGENWTEEKVKTYLSGLLKENKYCFLLTSSGNIDRISQFAQCIQRGKYFLMDDFQKQLLDIAMSNDSQCQNDFKKALVYGDNLKAKIEERGFGMIVRANARFEKLLRYYMDEHKDDSCLIYSMWTGYLEISAIKDFVDIAGKKRRTVHSSGHVVLQDLNEMINMLNPGRILFIHTESSTDTIQIDLKERIVNLKDNEELNLG